MKGEFPEIDFSKSLEFNIDALKRYLVHNSKTHAQEEAEVLIKRCIEKYSKKKNGSLENFVVMDN